MRRRSKNKNKVITNQRATIAFSITMTIGFIQFMLTFVDTIHVLGFVIGTFTLFGSLAGIFITVFFNRDKTFKLVPILFLTM
mmetsp:Transcript_24169/g.21474  ORF Transcript_24169/g.21474 Transcript_24169/m.21474 type:complete len:82 (+) Transcript_24169:13-258(+)